MATLWANGEGIRERIPAMLGRLACWMGKGISGCNTGDRSYNPEQLARKHAVHGATSTPCYSALSHRSEPGEKAVSYRLPFDRTWVIAN